MMIMRIMMMIMIIMIMIMVVKMMIMMTISSYNQTWFEGEGAVRDGESGVFLLILFTC